MNRCLHSHFSMYRACVVYFLVAISVLLPGCAVVHGAQKVAPREAINVSGTVEKICTGCDTVDLVNGGAVTWDVITVRLTSPETLSGTELVVKVLIEGDGSTQRKAYSPSSRIAFHTMKAAVDARRVMLHLSDMQAID